MVKAISVYNPKFFTSFSNGGTSHINIFLVQNWIYSMNITVNINAFLNQQL
jgi:hypothetical protein